MNIKHLREIPTGLFPAGVAKYTTLFHHKYDMVVEKQAKTSNK